MRNFDIPTAIDVLTTGTYQRLPSRIKQVYVEEEMPSRTEIAATLEKLDDVIRMRLLCDELVPPAMEYTIGKGKAKFVVPNEFEVRFHHNSNTIDLRRWTMKVMAILNSQ